VARTALDDDVLIMDADVLFHHEILRRLVQSPYPNALLMDDSIKQTGEECMVVAEGSRVIALTKTMPSRYDRAGEGVGFLKVRHADTPHMVASLRTFVDRDAWQMEYEDALIGFFQDVKVGYEVVGGLPWTEIDFPEDVVKAEREILPKL
jgi:choline kinase